MLKRQQLPSGLYFFDPRTATSGALPKFFRTVLRFNADVPGYKDYLRHTVAPAIVGDSDTTVAYVGDVVTEAQVITCLPLLCS